MNDLHDRGGMFCPLDGMLMQPARYTWLYSCPACGLEGSTLTPSISSGERSAELDEVGRQEGLRSIRTANGQKILDEIQDVIKTGTLLDVGSGPGFFLSLAKERGFDVSGVEPDLKMAGVGLKQGYTVYAGFFPEAVPDLKFDVIVLNDVLEHIPDLVSVFAGFRSCLVEGGTLVLNCPNRLGLFYRAAKIIDRLGVGGPLRRMWQIGLPSPHIWYFTVAQLRELGEKEGFIFMKEVKLETLSRKGLYERVTYVKGQSRIFNFIIFSLIWCILPLIKLLPSDLGVVVFKKS